MTLSFARFFFSKAFLNQEHKLYFQFFFVIPDHQLSVKIMFGHDVLQQDEFKLNKSGVKLIKAETNSLNSARHFCIPLQSHISITEDTFL